MKDVIAIKLAEGEDTESIKAYFVDQYGPQVLGEPPLEGFNWLAWILPVLAFAIGGVFVWRQMRRMMRSPSDQDAAPAPRQPPRTKRRDPRTITSANWMREIGALWLTSMSWRGKRSTTELHIRSPTGRCAVRPAQAPRCSLLAGRYCRHCPCLFGLLAWRLLETNRSEHRASGGAPPFAFTTFEGETISLDDLRGQGVVLNFWASWCDPCRDEAALLEQTWQREKENGIVFIGLDYLTKNRRPRHTWLSLASPTQRPDQQSDAGGRYGHEGRSRAPLIDPAGRSRRCVISSLS